MIELTKLVQQIHSCSAFDSAKMVSFFQQYLMQKLNADKVTWYAAYRGRYGRNLWQTKLMANWKVVDIIFPIGVNKDRAIEMKEYFRKSKVEGNIDPQVEFAIKHAGCTRVNLLHEAIDQKTWSNHWMNQRLLDQGVGERMVGSFNLSSKAESYFLVDRSPNSEPFTQNDKQSFYEDLISFPRLHFWLFLERGLIEPALRPFSPREREVLQLLLGSGTEQDIATELGLSQNTVHSYVRDIYNNINVKSRYELVQLWLQAIVK